MRGRKKTAAQLRDAVLLALQSVQAPGPKPTPTEGGRPRYLGRRAKYPSRSRRPAQPLRPREDSSLVRFASGNGPMPVSIRLYSRASGDQEFAGAEESRTPQGSTAPRVQLWCRRSRLPIFELLRM